MGSQDVRVRNVGRRTHELIVIGLIAHSCVEATVRYGAELGYQVTVVKDATTSGRAHHEAAIRARDDQDPLRALIA